ncbi:ROK family transcriptional regulator [Demequina sp. NBRC 110052]|uniref:ROK family transcriptional regulator n=1 Tax=Demequina sp. NBRC 110052 TaxID=1570341 RepID=UPI0009FEA9FE|nr:ROK family transcriptional regulator [Demequina sp. NBRC 110052]
MADAHRSSGSRRATSQSLAAGKGSGLDATRRHNLATILTSVHHGPGSSRAELTRSSGLNRSTVLSVVAELEASGLLYEVLPSEHTGRGRPSPLVYPKDDIVAAAIHPDLDGITLALVGLGGSVKTSVRRDLSRAPSIADTVELSREMLDEARTVVPRGTVVVGAGVAVPALVRAEGGVVVRAPHLDWSNRALGDELHAALDLPVEVRNDARVATVAETVFGVGRGERNLVYLHGNASGIGGGAVVGGAMLRGRDGFAAEFGHTRLPGASKACHCGRIGCLETEVNLARLVAATGERSVALADLDRVLDHHSEVPRVRAEVRRQLTAVASTISDLASVFNPDLVVLGGFLGSLYSLAPEILDAAVEADSFAEVTQGMRIARATLGARAQLIGAAEVCFLPLLRRPAAFGALIADLRSAA